MPQISISQATFERLQKHAVPLVDDIESVINKLIDQADTGDIKPPQPLAGDVKTHSIDPRDIPSLTHTKVLHAAIGGKTLQKNNWNAAFDEILSLAAKQVDGYEALPKLCPANMVKGRKETDGYSYLPDIDISVQGQDANAACRAIVTLARHLGIEIDITFMWRPKEKATFPGERGRLFMPGAR
ncbi:hypothetical protein IWQ49_000911 [Labrenzia sp. EL_126]|nr:hypothetical protein [Labrenzia sp. EL_126]